MSMLRIHDWFCRQRTWSGLGLALVVPVVLFLACTDDGGKGDDGTTSGDGDGDAMTCKLPCANVDECGGADTLVDCVDGYCEYVGCSADTDCSAGAVCRVVEGVSYCLVDCTTDTDCSFNGMPCVEDDNGANYCDLDWGPGGCTQDSDCVGNGGICDVATGSCLCSDDASCEAAMVCR
jgi:hypothetical protein